MTNTATDAKTGVGESIKSFLAAQQEPQLSDAIQAHLQLPVDQVLMAIQDLLSSGAVQLRTTPADGQRVRVGLSTSDELAERTKLKGLTVEEKLVHQVIQQVGNKGIWIKDMRFQTNLPAQKLQKALKALEARNLVKTVKSATSTTKKIYMLSELTPGEALTGGKWYHDGNLDEEMISQARQLCMALLQEKGEVTLGQFTAHLTSRGFANLSSPHVQQVLSTLVLDGYIDEQQTDDGESAYMLIVMSIPDGTPLNDVPCGQCPVIHECAEGNDVSPATCEYMRTWLDF